MDIRGSSYRPSAFLDPNPKLISSLGDLNNRRNALFDRTLLINYNNKRDTVIIKIITKSTTIDNKIITMPTAQNRLRSTKTF